MRPLVIDDTARAEIQRVLSYAMDHIYRPRAGGNPPGDDLNHVAMLGTYRVVFSFTEADGVTFRHLSVSVPSAHFANPAAVFMIAHEFGFTGWDERTVDRAPAGWVFDIKNDEHCIVVGQRLSKQVAA